MTENTLSSLCSKRRRPGSAGRSCSKNGKGIDVPLASSILRKWRDTPRNNPEAHIGSGDHSKPDENRSCGTQRRALFSQFRKSWEVLTLIAGGSSMDSPNSTGGVRCGRFQLPHVNRTRLARISNSGDWFDHRLCAHAGGRHSERSPRRLFPISGGSAAGFCHRARRLAGWAAQADGAGAVSGCRLPCRSEISPDKRACSR